MNLSKWFVRAEELCDLEDFLLLPLDAQKLNDDRNR